MLLVSACAVVLFTGSEDSAASPTRLPALLEIEHDGLRYTYHLPTGQESLFDIEADPRARRNLARDYPSVAGRLRAMLAERHGVRDVGVLRNKHYGDDIQALNGLGYL